MKKWPNKALNALLLALPVVVFFTNFPLIRLGENSSMYFEISLPMIWLAVFDLLSLTRAKQMFTLCKKHKKVVLPIFAFLVHLALSCIWSANSLRGLLTVGLAGAIIFAVLSYLSTPITDKQKHKLLIVYLFTSATVSLFCLVQGFLDVSGIQQNLLCPGCHYQTIGFPHSNGFAIEPQFMGNLLIAPSLITLDLIYKKKGKRKLSLLLCLAFLQVLALFITFSRGAIFAFVLGIIILTVYRAVKKFNLRAFCYFGITALAFLGGLLLQGFWAERSPTSEDFFDGISRSINQLSLGKIALKKPEVIENIEKKQVDLEPKEDSDFNGYIEESTTIRLSLNELALKTWQQNPKTILFGVGLGGAGRAMHQYLNTNEREIVQNEYVSLLLELGIVGCILVLFAGFSILRRFSKKLQIVIITIVIAYLFTLLFFSGITNVWHIYLLTPLLAPILERQARMLK